MVTPAARREAVAHLEGLFEVSQRRACTVLGVDRTMVRYRSQRGDDASIRERMRGLAAERRTSSVDPPPAGIRPTLASTSPTYSSADACTRSARTSSSS